LTYQTAQQLSDVEKKKIMKSYSVYVNLESGKSFRPADWQLVASANADNKKQACEKVRAAAFSGKYGDDVTLYDPQSIPVSDRGRTMKAEKA